MALTNFTNGISSMGIPVIGSGGMLPPGPGKVFFVDYTNGSDGNNGTSTTSPFQTVEYAYTQATSGNDDIIALMGSATHVLSAMLTVSKSRVHFVGIDGTNGRLYGQNAKVSLTATSGATNVFTMKNTGVRNSFTNIKWMNASTVAQGLYCVGEGGEYAVYTNCEFYKSTDLNETTAAELVLNGDSAQFIGCTFGSLADLLVGDIIRPCVELTKETVGTGLVTRDSTMVDCMFWRQLAGTAGVFIRAAASGDVERMLLLQNPTFVAANLGSTPAVCIASATLTDGWIAVNNPAGFNVTKIATATGVLVNGAAPNSGTGIAVNAV
ncbi:MAG: hypothetical protein WC829_04495 [Hyphomicrobium sp.]|jgi:hypothetical protein